jgi:hypothetical protein
VLPGRPAVASEHVDIEAVVAQFGGVPAVRVRFEELAVAVSSLVLFLEYVPDPVLERLTDPVIRPATATCAGARGATFRGACRRPWRESSPGTPRPRHG